MGNISQFAPKGESYEGIKGDELRPRESSHGNPELQKIDIALSFCTFAAGSQDGGQSQLFNVI